MLLNSLFSVNSLIKLSDYLVLRLKQEGLTHIFTVVGGASLQLNESFAKCKEIVNIFTHHEQAAAIAAKTYARIKNELGVCLVTAGPGGTNTLTGVAAAWTDSLPVLFISGQVKRENSLKRYPYVRQLGVQEINIVDVVKPITKYAVCIDDPTTFKQHLEKAMYIAKSGRPGPVWLDIPFDVQNTLFDVSKIRNFEKKELVAKKINFYLLKKQVTASIDLFRKAKRPVVIAGFGIRLSKAKETFERLIDILQIPVLTSMSGHDLIYEKHPLFSGRFGLFGDRGGNFTVQNADLILSIGSRLMLADIGYQYKDFAKNAKKIIVDIDQYELRKPTIKPDLPINFDTKLFMEEMIRQLTKTKLLQKNKIYYKQWIKKTKDWRKKYPVILPEYAKEKKYVNSYFFIKTISDLLEEKEIIVTGVGTSLRGTSQSIKLKKDQRLCSNTGLVPMGYDLPAAIGACFAANKKRVILITGDGSIQMNIQELQTIAYHKLPIKIFILSNNGYLVIRASQSLFFKHLVGTDKDHGISFPNMQKIAKAYGISAIRIENHNNLKNKLKKVLDRKGPVICEIMINPDQELVPRIKSAIDANGKPNSRSLEDMYPYLSRKELSENIIIKTQDIKK